MCSGAYHFFRQRWFTRPPANTSVIVYIHSWSVWVIVYVFLQMYLISVWYQSCSPQTDDSTGIPWPQGYPFTLQTSGSGPWKVISMSSIDRHLLDMHSPTPMHYEPQKGAAWVRLGQQPHQSHIYSMDQISECCFTQASQMFPAMPLSNPDNVPCPTSRWFRPVMGNSSPCGPDWCHTFVQAPATTPIIN
jgi:hypothetical protein